VVDFFLISLRALVWMTFCVSFGSEQSPPLAFPAKRSLPLARFWKTFFAAQNLASKFNATLPLPASKTMNHSFSTFFSTFFY
jgi:hypothetical protein